MIEEKKLSRMMKDDSSVPTPNFERIWSNIQNEASSKHKVKQRRWIPIAAALTILTFSVGTSSYAKPFLDFFDLKLGQEKVEVESASPYQPNVDIPDNVGEYQLYYDFSQASEILGITPVKPTYLPQGYVYTNEEGINGVPNYKNGKVTHVSKEYPSYQFYYSKGDKNEDHLAVHYNVSKINKNATYSVRRENAEEIEIRGLKGVLHDNGLLVYKELDNDRRLHLELLTESKISREESKKVMESILKNLK